MFIIKTNHTDSRAAAHSMFPMIMGRVTSLPHRLPGITLAVFFISIYFIWVAALSYGVSGGERIELVLK